MVHFQSLERTNDNEDRDEGGRRRRTGRRGEERPREPEKKEGERGRGGWEAVGVRKDVSEGGEKKGPLCLMITPSNSISCQTAAWLVYDVREERACVSVCVCVPVSQEDVLLSFC